MEPLQRLQCEWCQSQNPTDAVTCKMCGAGLSIKRLVSESGWINAPRLREGTEIQFGHSRCQVEGEIVPVAELELVKGDSVYFEHRAVLWKEAGVRLAVMQLSGGIKRMLAGMPFFITIASGPGRLAFSRDAAGEMVVLPLHPGMELDVREHTFLLASTQIQYSYVSIQGLKNILFGGQGVFMDRFVTTDQPGLLVLHGYGNVFERTLREGESLMIEPGSFLYKDASVQMEVVQQPLASGLLGSYRMNLVRMSGPGRLGIQSMYQHPHAKE